MKSVLIFCGANKGTNPIYEHGAKELATMLAKRKIDIITGGGSIGLMGAVADATLAAGGKVTGIIPEFLNKMEVGHGGLSKMIIVDTMHERKMLMHDQCDAIIALPGGFGTLDELFESLTWAQLEQHIKPIGILNTGNYYDHLLQFVQHMCDEGMLKDHYQDLFISADDPEALISMMQNYVPPIVNQVY
ncbi:MAG: TIGR00730 family Rossman fold protein [Saprospiraceae bacterium]